MKSFTPTLRVLVALLVSSALSFAEATAEPNQQGPESVANISLEQAVSYVNDETTLAHGLKNFVEKLCAPIDRANEETEREREIKENRFVNRLRKEISRYRVRFTLGDISNILSTQFLTSGATYSYVVEPAFRNNEQLRKDIWAFRIGAQTPTTVSVGASTIVRFTFTRFYGGANAKWNAMKACPYLPNQIPMNSNEVKTKLRDGDGFRFEVIGSTGIGTSRNEGGDVTGDAGLTVKTEALFLMDLFKINSQITRTRLLGVKNRGEVSIGFSIKNESPITFIRGKIRDILTLGIGGSVRKTVSLTSIFDKYPLDTMMVDYLYKFSTPDKINLQDIKGRTDIAEAALEQLFDNIKKLGFVKIFVTLPGNSTEQDVELGERLLDKVKISEDLSKEDLERYRRGEIEARDMRVRSFFKGRMQSNLIAGEGRLWFSEIFSKKSQIGNLDSFVTSFDENIRPQYFYLNSSFERGQTKKYFGRSQYNFNHDFDVLVHADATRQVGKISDIVIRTEVQDTDMSVSDINQLKSNLQRSLPDAFKNDPKFLGFFPTSDQTNAFLSYRFAFGHETFKAISELDRVQIYQKLFEFLENHPKRYLMNLPSDHGDYSQNGNLSDYAYDKAGQITEILDPNKSNEESLKSFKIAQRDPVFEKYILSEFFTSLLPPENLENLFGLNLRFSSRELGSPTPLNVGKRQVSPVYEAVSFLRSVLSDPSLDMQIVGSTDNTGSEVIRPINTNNANLPARISSP